MQTLKTGFFAVLCAALLAAPAHAEKADRDKPVNLEADTVTLDDIRKVSVYRR
jgi:lipopolysaccharide export system protein LptA